MSQEAISKSSSAEIRLLERVRLLSFQGLLPDAENRVRCHGKHPPVLIEDFLKAEIVSMQLVLALEEIAKSVKRLLSKEQKRNDDVADEAASLKCFQNALSQSTNALNQLTHLQISENPPPHHNMPPEPKDTSSRKASTSMIGEESAIPKSEHVEKTVRKRLWLNSDCTNNYEICAPSDTIVNECSILATENTEGINGEAGQIELQVVKEIIETLRQEIQELQIKHEKQFLTYAAPFFNQEEQSMRELLEKILANLSPQDKNWTYHGKLDDHCKEQMFYFVSLQKTLKNCLAILSTININKQTENIEQKEIQGCCISEIKCPQSSRLNGAGIAGDNDVKTVGKNDDAANNHSSRINGKRMNDFEDEQRPKKRKKGIFACFNTKWTKSKRSKH